MLTILLKNEQIQKAFHLNLYKNKPIIFVDTREIFKDFHIDSIYGREVEVVHDSSYINVINNSNIIVYDLVKKRNKYRIELYHKIMEAYGYVEFTKKRGQYVVSKVFMGNF